VWYKTGTSRASGSPETAAFNSLANAFIAFVAWRRTRRFTTFVGADEAYSRLGIYGGDDGLTGDIDQVTYVKAAELVGQVLTAETIRREDIGVEFLSRKYGPLVWNGDTTSICDIERQVVKLHVTVALAGVSPEEKLVQKCRNFVLTDANTPVVGPIAKRVMELSGESPDWDRRYGAWFGQYDEPNQYPNATGSWMTFFVPEDWDLNILTKWLSNASSVHQLIMTTPRICPERVILEPAFPAVIRGERRGPSGERPDAKPSRDSGAGLA
jgi:hypothetical protein